MRITHSVSFAAIFLLLYAVPFVATAQSSMVKKEDLVKVSPSNDMNCVEYYMYQQETYCSTKQLQKQLPDLKHLIQYEKFNIVFDDRLWRLGWGKQDGQITTLEYTPNGEDINHWNELITSQFFPGLQNKVSLKDFSNVIMDELKNTGFNPKINIIEESENRIILEFRIIEPKSQAQDELQLYTKDQHGIHLLHYVIKKLDMGEEKRKYWIENLKKSELK